MVDISKLSRAEIDKIIDLLGQLVTHPDNSDSDRDCAVELAIALGDRATALDNKELSEHTPAVKSLIEKFKGFGANLKALRDRAVASAQGLNVGAQIITAFGKLVGVLAKE